MDSNSNGFNIVFVIFCLQVFGLGCEGIGYPPPPNCAVYECPSYDVIHSEPQFEIRAYKEANWVSFPVFTSSLKAATRVGFTRLFGYVAGKNNARAEIPITVPGLEDIGFSTNSSTYVVYFYLPKKCQEQPPLPLSPRDKIVKMPPFKYAAVRRFERPFNDKNLKQNALALRNSLNGTPWQSASAVRPFTGAMYNDPFDPHVVNEVFIWFNQ